jgi:hypothetical protein
MAHTVSAREYAEDPAVVAARAGSSERGNQAAEPDELVLDVLDDEEEAVDEEAEDDVFDSDDDFDSDGFVADDEDAGALLDDEPRLSLR